MKSLNIYIKETQQTHVLLIGQNCRENDTIVSQGNPDDIWFHLDNISSPHFVLQVNNTHVIPKEYLYQIALLFKDFKSNLPSRYKVIYTELKNVKKTKTLGTVITTNTKVITVKCQRTTDTTSA